MRPKPGHDAVVQSFLSRSCNLLAMLCVLCVSLAFVRCNVNLDASRLTVPAEALQTSATRTDRVFLLSTITIAPCRSTHLCGFLVL